METRVITLVCEVTPEQSIVAEAVEDPIIPTLAEAGS